MDSKLNLSLVVLIVHLWMSGVSLEVLSPCQLSNSFDSRYQSFVCYLFSELAQVRLLDIFELVDLFLDPRCIWSDDPWLNLLDFVHVV